MPRHDNDHIEVGKTAQTDLGPVAKMAVSVFPCVRLRSIGDANGEIQRHSEQQPLRLEVKSTPDTALLNLSNSDETSVFKCSLSRETECSRVGKQSFIITLGCNSVLLQFSTPAEFTSFYNILKSCRGHNAEHSVFSDRTEESSAVQYFQVFCRSLRRRPEPGRSTLWRLAPWPSTQR
uniref:Uncharacterized protein n=1 Tax=Hucho hucho TaxID=62062 RepID=A0A4W5K8Q9_9TELE